jgi:hypothetical protein
MQSRRGDKLCGGENDWGMTDKRFWTVRSIDGG